MTDNDKANKPIEDEIIITNEDDTKDDAKIKDTSEVDETDADDGGDDDPAREELRAKRREERKRKRKLHQQSRDKNLGEIDRLTREKSELAERLAQLESRALQQDSRDLDNRLSFESRRYQEAEVALANAIKTQDSDLFYRAQRQKDDAAFRVNEINSVKQRVSQSPARPRIDPMATKLAKEFTEDNPWIDLNGRDEDSLVALAVDKAVAADGFKMESPEYWNELERRLEKRLPHRFRDDEGSRKSAPVGGGKSGAASAKREFTFSPSRIEAMKFEGIWGDKAKMQSRAKYYSDYDRKNANS